MCGRVHSWLRSWKLFSKREHGGSRQLSPQLPAAAPACRMCVSPGRAREAQRACWGWGCAGCTSSLWGQDLPRHSPVAMRDVGCVG